MRRRTEERSPASVYASLAPAVLGYFRSHRVHDPENLTGDVFVGVTEQLSTFRGDDGALRRWVFTIAHHRRVDEIRRTGRRPEVLVPEVGHHPPSPATVESAAVDPDLVIALGRLTAEQRDVLVLRYVADLSLRTVAAITGRKVGAVKMMQARGLAAMARGMGTGRVSDDEVSPDDVGTGEMATPADRS